ncbi:MAG: DUF6326 family protein [Saprospiraceae bacterium]
MKSNVNNNEMPSMKSKIEALWLFAMLTYTYGDVVTLMDPVKHGSIELTESFLLGGSIYMMIPLSMVLLSRLLNYKANRLASIIAGSIMTSTLIMTLFVAVPTSYYVFFTAIEVLTTASIVGFAWKWRNNDGGINTTFIEAKTA